MNNSQLCRLCLVPFDSEKTLILTDGCDFITKLSFCLSHHIQVTQDLPNRICDSCYENVEKIHIFREKIIQNEYALQNRLKDPISSIDSPKGTIDNCGDTIYEADDQSINIKSECNNENSLNNDIDSVSLEDTKALLKNEDELSECYPNSEDCNPANTEDLEQIEKSDFIEDNMCLTCFNKFPSRLDLIHHYQNVERPKHKNNESENKIENFNYNIINSNGNSLYRCDQCSKEYTSKKIIKRHFLSHCLDDRPFLCKLCGRTYKTAIEIANHAKVHGGEVFVCSFKCGYSSVHKHVIKDHEKRHRKEYKYKCETCGKQFQVKTWYLQHQNIHNDVKPYVCKICGMAFHLDRYLTQHRNTMHPQAVTQKRYMCVHCSLPCSSKSGLALHLKEHDLGTSVESLCDECGKVLKNPQQLKCHKRIHLNPKPYVCGTCDKSFAKKSNLRVHEMIHTVVRFPCDRCGRRFTQRSSLNRHLHRHRATELCALRCRDFVQKCARCSKTYYNKKEYLKHNKICQ